MSGAPAPAVAIVPFEPRDAADFKRLNVEWLEKYFVVEPIDEEVLSQPQTAILDPGGVILLARYQDEVVGTCALIKQGADSYELSKMAVTARCQGLQIGRRLLVAAIERFTALGGRRLFLESNRTLTPALTLYAAHGFVDLPRPGGPSHYARADIYMEYRPTAAP